jgi:hypothetical protein
VLQNALHCIARPAGSWQRIVHKGLQQANLIRVRENGLARLRLWAALIRCNAATTEDKLEPPAFIEGFAVIEYGFFPEPVLPTGYVPPPDGRPPLAPVQNLAICTADGVDGYYLLFCTPDWQQVTYFFDETLEYAKQCPAVEFGRDVDVWHKRA